MRFSHKALHSPLVQQCTLLSRRVYILPTRNGLLFALLLLVMLIGSINYNKNLGYLLTFLLTSLNIVSILHTYRNLAHIRLRVGQILPVFVGEIARFVLHLDNPQSKARYAIEIGTRALGPQTQLDLAKQTETSATLALSAEQRGIFRPDRLMVSTRFPLGLYRAWAYPPLDLQCLVYPQPMGEQGLPSGHFAQTEQTGAAQAGGDDFIGFRPYQVGDSLRRVHWPAWARGRGLHTKQFGGDAAQEFILDWALLPPALTEEQRLQQLCRWILEAHHNNSCYGLRLPGQTLAPAQGEKHRDHCLKALALYA